MANTVPAANTNVKSVPYDAAQYQTHQGVTVQIGGIAGAAVQSNGSYAIFTAFAPSIIYASVATVVLAGGVAAGTLTPFLVRANNGANVSSNIALGNAMPVGINVAGNVFTTGPYSYNVFANGAASSSNVALPGGISVNTGDTLILVSTLNTAIVSVTTEFSLQPGASVTA